MKYRVDCSKSKNTPLKKGDIVSVEGSSNKLRKNVIKANKIQLLDENYEPQNVPICKCGRLDFSIKRLIRDDFNEKGLVVSVTETKDGFWFDMELIKKPDTT